MTNYNSSILEGMSITPIKANKTRTSYPFISVGNNRLEINAAVIKQLYKWENYKFANLEIGTRVNQKYLIIRLLETDNENAHRLSVKKQHGKTVMGLSISSKTVLEEVFGEIASSKKMTRFSDVKVDPYASIIVVCIKDNILDELFPFV